MSDSFDAAFSIKSSTTEYRLAAETRDAAIGEAEFEYEDRHPDQDGACYDTRPAKPGQVPRPAHGGHEQEREHQDPAVVVEEVPPSSTKRDSERRTDNGEDGQLNIFAKAKKIRHLKPHALISDWDSIEEVEGITMSGHNGSNPEKNRGRKEKSPS